MISVPTDLTTSPRSLRLEKLSHTNLRPRLETIDLIKHILKLHESSFCEGIFARGDVGGFEFVKMDDSEVDLADGGGVVVDEADEGQNASAADGDLFVELAAESDLVGVEGASAVGVGFVDVATNSERTLGPKARLAAGAASGIAKNLVAGAEDDVRDELLATWVIFDLGSWGEMRQLRNQESLQVPVGLGGKALKSAQAVELRTGHNKDAC